MNSVDSKYRALYSRAQFQVNEIQLGCKELREFVRVLSKIDSQLGSDVLECKKAQIIKTQIKDKLKEFASNIDEIYKLLDRKIMLLVNELAKEQLNVTGRFTERKQSADLLKESELLVKQLDAKLQQSQRNEVALKERIQELRGKNMKLIEEFNSLSTKSNFKISELTFQLQSQKANLTQSSQETVRFDKPQKAKAKQSAKKVNLVYYGSGQDFLESDYNKYYKMPKSLSEVKPGYGCTPSNTGSQLNFNESSLRVNKKLDKNHRFEFMLCQLRQSMQESTQISQNDSSCQAQQETISDHSAIKRYQI